MRTLMWLALGWLCASGSLAADGPGLVDAARNGDLAAVIQASDGASDGGQKRARALRARFGETADTIPWIYLFSSSHNCTVGSFA